MIAKVQQYYKEFPAQDEAVDVLRRRSGVLVNQAEVLLAQGKLDQALEAHQAALDIRQRLVERDPTKNDWQADLAVSFGGVGDVLVAQSKWVKPWLPISEAAIFCEWCCNGTRPKAIGKRIWRVVSSV